MKNVLTIDSEGSLAGVLSQLIGHLARVPPGELRGHLLQDQLVRAAVVHASVYRLLFSYLYVTQVPV